MKKGYREIRKNPPPDPVEGKFVDGSYLPTMKQTKLEKELRNEIHLVGLSQQDEDKLATQILALFEKYIPKEKMGPAWDQGVGTATLNLDDLHEVIGWNACVDAMKKALKGE